jgi:hypothetical protein
MYHGRGGDHISIAASMIKRRAGRRVAELARPALPGPVCHLRGRCADSVRGVSPVSAGWTENGLDVRLANAIALPVPRREGNWSLRDG